jgi:hypothetical protein
MQASKCTASTTIQLSQFPADQLRLVSSYLASRIEAVESEVQLLHVQKLPKGLLQANLEVSSTCQQVEAYADRLNRLREHANSLDHGLAHTIRRTAGFDWHGTARIVSPIESSASARINKVATSRNSNRRFPSVLPPDPNSEEASEDHSSDSHGSTALIFLFICGVGYFGHSVYGSSADAIADGDIPPEQGDAQEREVMVSTKYGGADTRPTIGDLTPT